MNAMVAILVTCLILVDQKQACQSTSQSTNQPTVSQLTNQATCLLTNQSTTQAVNQLSTNPSTEQPTRSTQSPLKTRSKGICFFKLISFTLQPILKIWLELTSVFSKTVLVFALNVSL